MYKQLATWNKDLDIEILLFPSDEFGGQELPSEEIAPFLAGFKLTKDLPLNGDGCRLMEKTTVNNMRVTGRHEHELHRGAPWVGPNALSLMASVHDGMTRSLNLLAGVWQRVPA